MIYSGIDLHKTNMVITTIDRNGRMLVQRKLSNQKRLVREYFAGYDQPHQDGSTSAIAGWSREQPTPAEKPATGAASSSTDR